MIWIQGFPLPPSVNETLMPVVGKAAFSHKTGKAYYKGRVIKTKVADQFIEQCHIWRIQNNRAFWRIKEALHKLKAQEEAAGRVFALRVDCWFVFHEERVVTKNAKSEQVDADNRLKPCWDGLKTILEIDDKAFYAGSCEKVTTRSKELECSIIRISQMRPRTLEEIKSLMLKETSIQDSSSSS